ncbi:DUF4209 domain-containing protein [Streptomyces sp. NPDC102441]|uniref:DUF4209 domain-containing protein n=1 Tax=Streptomyces sp. NPDC102441 TaxID=3366176 RepID=UPI003823F1A4
MPQVEPSVLGALLGAAKDAVSYEAMAIVLAAADIDTGTAVEQQRDALLAALRIRMTGTAQDFTGMFFGGPLRSWSVSLSEITDDELEVWSEYADAVSDPFLQGRLHHLLLVAGHGRKPDHIRGAAAGYLDAAPLLLAAPERVPGLALATECLRWAGELARTFNQSDLQKHATEGMVALVERVLAGPEDEQGIVDSLLKGLRTQGYDITDLAERAARRYADDVHAHVGFLKLLWREVAPGPRRTDIDTAIVNALLGAADADVNTGFRRLDLLTRAASEARDRGLSELRLRAEMALQRTDADSLGWTRIGRELVIPRALFELSCAPIDAATDLRDALWRTTEDVHPAMREHADGARAQEGLLRIPRTRINTVGPVQVAPPADADDDHTVELQVRVLDALGIFTAHQLDHIQERFEPAEAELITALAHDAVLPEPRARSLAHAFRYFWLGEFDASACIALPQVEQILRQLLRPRVPIVSVAKGHTPGTVDQLGSLIRSMPAAGYPSDWSRALELLLTDPDRGMNLRNNVCHGLIDTPPKHRVALILQAALYLLSHAHGHRTLAPMAQPAP